MAIGATNPVCKEICDALGLKHVRKFVLTMAVDSIVTVDVEYFPEIDGVKQVESILKKYTLAPLYDVFDVTTIGSTSREFKKVEDIA